jgi:hypothetical protein
MRAIVLPALRKPAASRLRLVERIVFRTDRPQMELVICGNVAGYRRLIATIASLLRKWPDPMEHVHVEDGQDAWVVKRSVALNIRGALRRWSRAGMSDYAEFVSRPTRHTLPPDIANMEGRLDPYQLPTPKEARALLAGEPPHRPTPRERERGRRFMRRLRAEMAQGAARAARRPAVAADPADLPRGHGVAAPRGGVASRRDHISRQRLRRGVKRPRQLVRAPGRAAYASTPSITCPWTSVSRRSIPLW